MSHEKLCPKKALSVGDYGTIQTNKLAISLFNVCDRLSFALPSLMNRVSWNIWPKKVNESLNLL